MSDNFSLAFGKNTATLSAFKTEEITIDGSTYDQDVTITSDSFNIVNLNSGYSIVHKTYTDNYVTMKDVYSTIYHDDTHGDYLIYEKEAVAQQSSYYTTKTSFPLYSKISVTNSNHSIRVYETENDKLTGNVYDEGNYNSNLMKLVGGDTKWIYIDVVDEDENVIKSYNVLLYCIRSLSVNVYKVTREAPNSDGDILVSNEDYTSSLTSTKVWENDILDINMIYSAIPTGMLVRDKNFNIFEKNTDYNTKDMLIEGDGDNVTINLYFSEEEETREHQAEVEAWSKYYTLSYKSGYSSTDAPTWNITYKDNYNDQTIVVPATIVGFKTALTTYSFNNSNVKWIIFETGTTSIPEKALFTCDSLMSVKIPSTVTSIGAYMLSSQLSSPEIMIEGNSSQVNLFNTNWNRIASTTNYYSYYYNQTDCCSIVNEGGAKIKVDIVNKTAKVVGTCDKNVIIPESVSYGINQYVVTAIESLTGAEITSLSIPKTITQISTNSYGSYEIPATLEQLVVDSENANFASYENALYNKDLSQIIYIPKSIGTLKLSETITEISGNAFNGFHKLEKVYIHAGVTSIEDGLFAGALITEYIVDSNNQNYKSEAHLFSKDGTELIRWATGSTQTVVPQTITKIHQCALYGYKWSEITIPFVGESATSSNKIGYMFNEQSNNYYLPNTLTTITISGGQSLADKAFSGCDKLTTINLPNTLTTIGEKAFNGCTALTSIKIPTSVTTIGSDAFTGCTNVTRVETLDLKAWFNIEFKNANSNPMVTSKTFVYFYVNGDIIENLVVPEGVTEIKSYAICDNTKIKSITTSSTVVSINSYAYYYDNESECPLKTVILNEGLQTIADNAIYIYLHQNIETVVIPSTVTSIGKAILPSFAYDTIKTLTIPFIGNGTNNSDVLCYLFGYSGYSVHKNYSKLTSITINGNCTVIPDNAFRNLPAVTSITFGDNCDITSIGKNAFDGCTALTSITIPSSVTSIDNEAFLGCTALRTVAIADGSKLTSIGSKAFYGCTALTSINLPNTLTSIGNEAFSGCASLTTASISVDCKLTSIGSKTFYGCTALTSITIPNAVTTIGTEAFSGCSKLSSVTFGDDSKLTSIGSDAFKDCSRLTQVEMLNLTPWFNIAFANEYANPLYYAKKLVLDGEMVTDLIVPEGITEIKPYALHSATRIKNLTISSGVTSIGDYAFYNTYFENVVVPSTVTSIGISAFENKNRDNTTTMTKISLPFVGDGEENNFFSYILGASSNDEYATYVKFTIKSVEITNATTIPASAFTGCKTIQNITIFGNTTTIGSQAFKNCTALQGLSIPSTVTTIDDNILTGCSNLYNLTVPFVGNGSTNLKLRYFYGLSDNTSIDDVINIGVVEVTAATQIGNNAFNGCTTITEVVLHNSVTSIGKQAFLGCKGLTKIELPDSLISIGQQAFSNCEGLTNITIPNSVTNIDKLAFAYCKGLTKVIISNKATSIGSSVFQSCTSLTDVTIPDGATEIGDSMFYGCTSLSKITIPNSVTTIGGSAFYGCTSLSEVTIPDGATEIGNSVFYGCTSLSEVIIPSSVTTIGESAFYDCSALETIVMSNNIISIGENAFYGVKYLTDYTTNNPEENLIYLYNSNNEPIVLYGCVDSTAVTGAISLPNTLKYIACSALERCTELTEITIPNGVTKIDNKAFYNCMGLTSITIPSSVTSIGNFAFSSCKGLTEIIIPNGVTNIGNYAFNYCTNLTSITISSSVTSIGGGAFANISATAEFYYLGTQEECDILSGNNVYYYSETEPTTAGNYWHYDTNGKTIVKWTVE